MKYGYIWTNKLSDKQVEDMKNGIELPLEDICEGLGSGVPAKFRITKDECIEWLKDKTINPASGRNISKNGKIYKDFVSVSMFYRLINE